MRKNTIFVYEYFRIYFWSFRFDILFFFNLPNKYLEKKNSLIFTYCNPDSFLNSIPFIDFPHFVDYKDFKQFKLLPSVIFFSPKINSNNYILMSLLVYVIVALQTIYSKIKNVSAFYQCYNKFKSTIIVNTKSNRIIHG